MSVLMKNGIGYSRKSGNRFIDTSIVAGSTPADARPPQVALREESLAPKGFAPWGVDNMLPDQMVQDIESCGILNSIIDHQSRLSLGEGVLWAWCSRDNNGKLNIQSLCEDPEILEFMELNSHFNQEYGWMRDQIGLANGVVRFVLDKAKEKIAIVQRDDVTEMRYGLMDENGKIADIYLSAQWDKISSVKEQAKGLIPVRLLDRNMPAADLIRRKNTGNGEFAYTFRFPSWKKKYYSMPLWYSNLLWVRIAQSIPEMKKAMYANSMRPKYQVTIYKQFWDNYIDEKGKSWSDYTEKEQEAKKNEVYDQIDSMLMGAENAGKSIFTDGVFDPINNAKYRYVEIEPIEDTTKDGGYLPDSAAANNEIAFSMKYNPSILGATMPSGPYTNSQGGSSVRESVAVQVISHEPERQNILNVYRIIRKFNKWDLKQAPAAGLFLEPIIPATILTTLDTGSGTKPVMLGGAQEQV